MNQICTNKKQSSRLLEAGVRLGTADMYLDEFECPVAFEYRRIEKHVGQDQLLYLLMRLDLEFIESQTPFLTLV